MKKLTFKDVQIPTQFINTATIAKGKNLRSIVNRILMQINSKLGGAPWAISEVPYSNKPTMIMGVNVWKKTQRSKCSILSCTMTTNARFNKYATVCEEQTENEDIGVKLTKCTETAIEAFKKLNKGVSPTRVIVYRDGISESQQKLAFTVEVPAIQKALGEGIKLAYLITNKRVNARYFTDKHGKLDTATPGMYIDKGIVAKSTDAENFYLVSQISRQGAASPSHYHILHADEEFTKQELILLTYKLCYLYFHINAGIKVPAPVQYAERLGAMLGDKVNHGKQSDYDLPGERFYKKPSLFYI